MKQQLLYEFGNQPQGMTQDPIEKNIFVADLALQSIFVYQSLNVFLFNISKIQNMKYWLRILKEYPFSVRILLS